MAAQFALKAALRKSMNKTLRALSEDQLSSQCVCALTLSIVPFGAKLTHSSSGHKAAAATALLPEG
jgi:hypothetical protein